MKKADEWNLNNYNNKDQTQLGVGMIRSPNHFSVWKDSAAPGWINVFYRKLINDEGRQCAKAQIFLHLLSTSQYSIQYIQFLALLF